MDVLGRMAPGEPAALAAGCLRPEHVRPVKRTRRLGHTAPTQHLTVPARHGCFGTDGTRRAGCVSASDRNSRETTNHRAPIANVVSTDTILVTRQAVRGVSYWAGQRHDRLLCHLFDSSVYIYAGVRENARLCRSTGCQKLPRPSSTGSIVRTKPAKGSGSLFSAGKPTILSHLGCRKIGA